MCLTIHSLPQAAAVDLGERAMAQVLVLWESRREQQLTVLLKSLKRGPGPAPIPGTLTHSRLSSGIVWKLSWVSTQQGREGLGTGGGVQPLRTTIKLDFSGGPESRDQRSEAKVSNIWTTGI